MTTIGACVISRNDNYGGDLASKFTYSLNSLIRTMDEVYYIDWNSPGYETLFDSVRDNIAKTGKLRVIVVNPGMAEYLVNSDTEVQNCVEVLARNIGIRRLNTDYIISTNSDIMVGTRENILSGIKDDKTFHTIARTNLEYAQVASIGLEPDSIEIGKWVDENFKNFSYAQFGSGSPLGPRDKWSLISCPGDFQLAHRDVWYGIKGFEESLVYRGYTDSNVQRKADYYGFKQALVRDIVALHFNHYPGSGSTGGNSAKWNTEDCLFNFQGTTNEDTWGFSHINFEEEII